MDIQFHKFYLTKIRYSKAICDLLCAVCIFTIAEVIGDLIPISWCVDNFAQEFFKHSKLTGGSVEKFSPFYSMMDDFNTLCVLDYREKLWQLFWVLLIPVRAICISSKLQAGPLLRMCGLYLTYFDNRTLNIVDGFKYVVIEWLPVYLGILYALIIGFTPNLFNIWLYSSIVLGIQALWLAPVIFRFHNKNCVEILTGISVNATETNRNKLEMKFVESGVRQLNKLSIFMCFSTYLTLLGLFLFYWIQIIRVPSLLPDYQKTLYGGYELVWKDNSYFALNGLLAPKEVDNFYQYGLTKSYRVFLYFEAVKNFLGIQIAYDDPELRNTSQPSIPNNEIRFNSENWKQLECLFNSELKNKNECASFSDYLHYIRHNKTIWQRFNKLPESGFVYKNFPHSLYENRLYLVDLTKLKATHIIYLLTQGENDAAMQEWLRYMAFYQAMSDVRGSVILKSINSVILNIHINTLETLLFRSPQFANRYFKEIGQSLKFQHNFYKASFLMIDELGMYEVFMQKHLGNINALKNEYYACFKNYQAYVLLPLQTFPFGQTINYCPTGIIRDRRGVQELFLYAITKPGYWKANMISDLLFSDISLAPISKVIEKMKVFQVKLKLAGLANEVLNKKINSENIGNYIQNVPINLQNPITQAPFLWDKDNKYLYFEHPITKNKVTFSLNI